MALLICAGIWAYKTYQSESKKIGMHYEDYLDWIVFEHIKRGHKVSSLARVFYLSDTYSVEGKSN